MHVEVEGLFREFMLGSNSPHDRKVYDTKMHTSQWGRGGYILADFRVYLTCSTTLIFPKLELELLQCTLYTERILKRRRNRFQSKPAKLWHLHRSKQTRVQRSCVLCFCCLKYTNVLHYYSTPFIAERRRYCVHSSGVAQKKVEFKKICLTVLTLTSLAQRFDSDSCSRTSS